MRCHILYTLSPRNKRSMVITTPVMACAAKVYTQTIWKERLSACNQDIQTSYPQFLYSKTTTSGNPHKWKGMYTAAVNFSLLLVSLQVSLLLTIIFYFFLLLEILLLRPLLLQRKLVLLVQGNSDQLCL